MKLNEFIFDEWQKEWKKLGTNAWFKRLEGGDITAAHYASYLQETYHQTGLNPQIQAAATLCFPGRPRDMVKKYYQHAISEISHDLLALDDLVTLGADRDTVISSTPLPATRALIAFPIYEMQYVSPLVYLGYLYHLEYLPTQGGAAYAAGLAKAGIPECAMTFLIEHATVDVHHNKLMQSYIAHFVTNEREAKIVAESARATCVLHGHMTTDAFERGNDLSWFKTMVQKVA
jgi:pyrroloquinoline quinone (PQQ) biosynthesis protein C